MKRAVLILAVVVLGFCAAGVSFAQTQSAPKHKHHDKDVVRGIVVSVDEAKNEIVVKSAKTQKTKTVTASAEKIREIKVGDEVKAVMPTGKNTAESVTVEKTASKEASKQPKEKSKAKE